MSIVLKFRKNVTDLSLMGGATGLQLIEDGWNPLIATPVEGAIPPTLMEMIQAEGGAATQDALATVLQNLHAMQASAEQYLKDATAEYPVWLHAKLDSETGERRALVRRIEAAFGSGWFGAMAADNKAALSLSVEREPYWERAAVKAMPEGTPSPGISVSYDYTASPGSDVVGDAPARIEKLGIGYAVTGNFGRYWIGFRSANKRGTPANFVNVWELENGTNNASETGVTDEVDGTASGGNMVEVTEIDLEWDATWQKVLKIKLGDVTVNEADNLGVFLWLLRAKVDSGEWEIQLRYGYTSMSDDDRVQGRIAKIDSTGWNVYSTDRMPIPLRDLQCLPTSLFSASYEDNWEIQIWARRKSGSGDLNLDCLAPIPLDEGYIIALPFVDSGAPWTFLESPSGKIRSYVLASAAVTRLVQVETSHARLPLGDGRMIIAYAGETTSTLTDTIKVNGSDSGRYYECWSSLRGAE